MMKQKLELTLIGKDEELKFEPKILLKLWGCFWRLSGYGRGRKNHRSVSWL
jgi:hypothetical protein